MCHRSATKMLVALLLATIVGAASFESADTAVAIGFNETITGFGVSGGDEDDTIDDFEAAYEQGKNEHSELSFSGHMELADILKFVEDPLHTATFKGHVTARGITGPDGVAIADDATVSIFPHDGVPGNFSKRELGMKYSLPFQDAHGKRYLMVGVKHIPSNDCIKFVEHITHLFVHVYDMDGDAPHKIVRKGIVHIGLVPSLKLIASLRIHGGTWPMKPVQEVNGLVLFAAMLGKDVAKDCLWPWGADSAEAKLEELLLLAGLWHVLRLPDSLSV